MWKGCIFWANGRLIRHVDEFPTGGPISVAFSDIFCVKMEFDVVKLLKTKLCRCFVGGIYSKWI